MGRIPFPSRSVKPLDEEDKLIEDHFILEMELCQYGRFNLAGKLILKLIFMFTLQV